MFVQRSLQPGGLGSGHGARPESLEVPGLPSDVQCLVEQRPHVVVTPARPQPSQRVEGDEAGDTAAPRRAEDVEGVDLGLLPLTEVESASGQPRDDVLPVRFQSCSRRVGSARDERRYRMVIAPQFPAAGADLSEPEGDDRRELVGASDLDSPMDTFESLEPAVHDVGDPVLDQRPPENLPLIELGGKGDGPLPPDGGPVAIASEHVDRREQLIGSRQLGARRELLEELDRAHRRGRGLGGSPAHPVHRAQGDEGSRLPPSRRRPPASARPRLRRGRSPRRCGRPPGGRATDPASTRRRRPPSGGRPRPSHVRRDRSLPGWHSSPRPGGTPPPTLWPAWPRLRPVRHGGRGVPDRGSAVPSTSSRRGDVARRRARPESPVRSPCRANSWRNTRSPCSVSSTPAARHSSTSSTAG